MSDKQQHGVVDVHRLVISLRAPLRSLAAVVGGAIGNEKQR